MKVFISCSSLDKEIAYFYKEKLRALSVEVSTGASFNPGESFLDALRRELDSADLIVILLTNNYVSSSWSALEMNTVLLSRQRANYYVLTESGVVFPNYLSGISCGIVSSIADPGDVVFEGIAELPSVFAAISSVDTPLSMLKSQLQNSKVTLVIGAGASIDAGLPSWNTLISKAFSQYINDLVPSGLVEALPSSNLIRAKYLKTGLGEKLADTIHDILYADVHPKRAILEAVAKLAKNLSPIEAIISFNYDSLLEEGLEQQSVEFSSLCDKTPRNGCALPVYHVHGFLPRGEISQASEKIVFSEDEYHTQYIEPHGWSNAVQLYHYMNNVCLFIGTSLTDPNLRRLLDSARRTRPSNSPPTHYIIKKKPKTSDVQQKLMDLEEKDLQTLGLNMIWADSHGDEAILLDSLANIS